MNEIFSNALDCNLLACKLEEKFKDKIDFFGSTYQQFISCKYLSSYRRNSGEYMFNGHWVPVYFKFNKDEFLRISVGAYFSDSSFGEKMAVLSDLYSALSKEYGEPTVFYTLKNDSESLLNLQWSFVNEKDEIAKFKNGTYFDDAFIDTLIVFGEKNNFKSNLSDRTRSVISSCIGLPFELLYLVDSDIENFIKHKNGEEMIIPIESKEDSVSFQKKHKR